jgi:hypothetical protein
VYNDVQQFKILTCYFLQKVKVAWTMQEANSRSRQLRRRMMKEIFITSRYKWFLKFNMSKYTAQFILKYCIFHILWPCMKPTVLETLSAT